MLPFFASSSRERPRALARVLVLAAALLGPALAPASASAQPGDVAYKQHLENGIKLYQDKNYEAAIVEFQAAYAAHPKASPLVNIALAYKGLFNYPKAIQALEKALDEKSEPLGAEDRKAARDAIAEMKGLLAYVNVAIVPPQATLTIDGEDQPAGTAGAPVALGPGTHRIGAHLDGYAPAERTVTVASGEKDKAVRLRLVPDKGYVSIQGSSPRAVISVDETRVGSGGWAGLLTPGAHLVEIDEPNVAPYRANVVVVAGQAQTIRPGEGGVPVVATAPVPRAPSGPVVAPPPAPKPAPPAPPVRGAYALATGALLAPVTIPSIYSGGEVTSGAAGGVRLGYRVNTLAAFELMFEYGNVRSANKYDPNVRLSLSSTRLGANLKLMTPNPRFRFFGALGGGLVYDDFAIEDGGVAAGLKPLVASRCVNESSCYGFDAYLLSELGLEIEVGKVLIDAAFESYFQATKGISDPNHPTTTSPYDDDPLVVLGGGIHVGYAFW